jgi:hypothetical protein
MLQEATLTFEGRGNADAWVEGHLLNACCCRNFQKHPAVHKQYNGSFVICTA